MWRSGEVGQRDGLQNRYAPVRDRPAPPLKSPKVFLLHNFQNMPESSSRPGAEIGRQPRLKIGWR